MTQQKPIPNNSKSETVGVFSSIVTKQQDKLSSIDVFLEHQESRFL
jgi:predicted nucleotidyltransferase